MKVKNVRFIIAAITTLSAYSVYVSRINLSLTIIAMVNDSKANETTPTLASSARDKTAASAAPTSSSIIAGERANSSTSSPPDSSTVANTSLPIDDDDDQLGLIRPLALVVPTSRRSGVAESSISNNNGSSSGDVETAPHSQLMASVYQASKKPLDAPLVNQVKFDWTHAEQGHILGAFFYGYILFQIPGARIAESVGAKWILLIANAGSAVISLMFPLSTQLNSVSLLMLLRFVMGCCQSAFFPAAYVLFCRWLPEKERAVCLPIMLVGSNVGSISTYIMSSYLVQSSYGWPSVFYWSGFVCSLVTALWCIYGSNGPEDNALITDHERSYILKNTSNGSTASADFAEQDFPSAATKLLASNGKLTASDVSKLSTSSASTTTTTTTHHNQEASWSKLLKSVPVWTLILSMYGNEWSNVILCYELPTYLNTALHFPIGKNGEINSFFQLTYVVASPIFSSLGAFILARHLFGMKKIHVRKLFQSLATFGQLACFVGVPICGDNRDLIILLMFAAIVFKACANAGDIQVPGDLSPEFAGTIFAFANSIGNTAGFFAPLLAGTLVANPHQRDEWTPFWFITAAIMCFSGIVFLAFGETDRQDYFKRTKRNSSLIHSMDASDRLVHNPHC